MTCGDTQAQWVDSIDGSTWTGILDLGLSSEASVAAVFFAVDNLAAVTVGDVPLAGTWEFQSGQFLSSVATEGISYDIQVGPTTCASSKVTQADGGAGDAYHNGHSITLSRLT